MRSRGSDCRVSVPVALGVAASQPTNVVNNKEPLESTVAIQEAIMTIPLEQKLLP